MSYFDVFSLILGSSWIHHCQYCRRKTELLTTTLLLELKSEDKNSGIFACLFRCCLFSNLNQEIISAQTTSTRVFSTIMHTNMKSIFMTFFNFVKPFIPAVLPLFNKTLFKTLVIFNQAFQCFIVTTLCFFIMSHKLYLSMRVLFYTNKNELQQSSRFSIHVFSGFQLTKQDIYFKIGFLKRKSK